MTKLEEATIAAALTMSRDAKVELLDRLMIDLNDDEQKAIDPAWAVEIQRRVERANRGEGDCRPADEVVAELREKLRQRRARR
jgi:hypothetical protein